MFFSPELLTKKGVFAIAWLAGTCTGSRTKFTRILANKFNWKVDLVELCENILNPNVPLSLRLRGILLLGVTVIYKEYALELERDVIKVWNSLQSSSIVDNLGKACDIVSFDAFLNSRSTEGGFRINLDEESERLAKITLPLHVPNKKSSINDDLELYFDESNYEYEEDDTFRHAVFDDTNLFEDTNYITISGEDSYRDYDFESGRHRNDMSLGNISEGDLSPSRKMSQPFDIVIDNMKSDFDDIDYQMQKDIDSYFPTELDLLQNDESESVDITGFGIEDAIMDLGHEEMENNDEHVSNEVSSQTEEKKLIFKKPSIINDKEIELTNKKIQYCIDNSERLIDSKRIEMLLSSEKMMSHKSSGRMRKEVTKLFDQVLFFSPIKNHSNESVSLSLFLDKINQEKKLSSNAVGDTLQELDFNSLSDFKESDNYDSLSSVKDSTKDDLMSMDFNDGISESGWESFQKSSDHSPLSSSLINSINEHIMPKEMPKPENPRRYDRDSGSDIFRETKQSRKLLKFLENKSRTSTPISKMKKSSITYLDSSSISSSLSRNMELDDDVDHSMKNELLKNSMKTNDKWLNFDNMLTGSMKNTAARTFFQILVLSSSGHVGVIQDNPYDTIYISVN